MSFMTPILITPSVICACAAPLVSAAARNARLRKILMVVLLDPTLFWALSGPPRSHTQIVVEFFHIGVQFCVGEPVDDPPMFHHVMAVGKR
jgi:hypothetical protein